MICGLIIAVALGTGAVVRILSSVFIGEENREDLSALIYIAFTKAMLLTAVMTVLVVACAPLIGRIFFPDTASSVYGLTRQLFTIYGRNGMTYLYPKIPLKTWESALCMHWPG